MHDATGLRPLPYLSTDGWWLWDCKETANVFVVNVEGYIPALFNVKDVDRFLDFFGRHHDTTIIFLDRKTILRSPEDLRKRRTSLEGGLVDQNEVSADATKNVAGRNTSVRCDCSRNTALVGERSFHRPRNT